MVQDKCNKRQLNKTAIANDVVWEKKVLWAYSTKNKEYNKITGYGEVVI